MRLPRALAAITLVSCTSGRPPALAYRVVPAPVARPYTVTHLHDSVLAALGLPALATHALPAGYRELRLSRGHGMVVGPEYTLVRIVQTPVTTTGEAIRFRVRFVGNTMAEGSGRWAARRVRPSAPIDWQRLLTYVDSLQIEAFVAPTYNDFITDAGDLVVEVRRDSTYRAYEVNAPGWRQDPAGRHAAAIAHMVDSLDRLTRGY